jgi:predicted O-linked N-acetylglucosamine transferase (SPINDLY family)
VAHSRIRIGYLSADIRQHPLAYLMRSVFLLIDRARFEVFLFTTAAGDGSELGREILAGVEHHVDVAGLPVAEALARLRRARLHVLVDLNGASQHTRVGQGLTRHARTTGHTQGGRHDLLALQPAPVVVNYMGTHRCCPYRVVVFLFADPIPGYCGTQGSSFVHLHATDRITVPPHHARFFDERLLVMPGTYFVNDHRQRYTALPPPPPREALGLPAADAGQTVFCSFASLPKLDEDTVSLWLRILQRVPRSVLWLLRWPDACIPRLLEAAAEVGLDAGRFVFVNATDFTGHMARIPLCDLHLDPLHVSTHTVACDVLFAGVPTLTTPGRVIASRVAASVVSALGVPDMIAPTVAEYEQRAVRLGAAPAQLAALRQRVAAARDTAPLFATREWVLQWQAALRLAWDAPRGQHVIMRTERTTPTD